METDTIHLYSASGHTHAAAIQTVHRSDPSLPAVPAVRILPAKVPVIAGEEGICSGCGVATLSIDYYDIGYKAGEMGAEILMDGKDVKEMPIEFAPQVTKKYNKANCEALGITVPDDYVAIEE